MMTPFEFKRRFVDAMPKNVPAELRDQLAEFTVFDTTIVGGLGLHEADRAILAEVGLPRTAPPNLYFGGERVTLLAPLDGAPGKIIIGANMFGDLVCLDTNADGAVVQVDNASRSKSVTMNSSIVSLAHCLCAFAEFRTSGDAEAFRREVASVDPPAAKPQSWWMREVAERSS